MRHHPPHIYFVRAVDGGGPIKIGHTINLINRLGMLCAWSPVNLEVVATVPGDVKVERQVHALLEAHHSHREWFRPHPEVLDVMALACRGLLPENLPPPKVVGRKPRPGAINPITGKFDRRLSPESLNNGWWARAIAMHELAVHGRANVGE